MIATSYLDDFQPIKVNQAKPQDRIELLIGGGMQSIFSNDTRKARTLAGHYSYWNYVSITRIAEFCSGRFPQIGLPVRKPSQRHLSQSQRQHLKSLYGGVFQSSYDDLQPVGENHPLFQLFSNPNEEDSWEDFAFEVFLFWQLTGIVYIWAIPNGFGLPAALWVVPSQWVEEKRDNRGRLLHYEIRPDGDSSRKEIVPPQEMFKGRQKSPLSKTEGFSAIEAAPLWTDCVEWIEQSRGSHFRQGANPDVYITLPEGTKDSAEDVITRIQEKWKRRYSGVNKHGDPAVVPPGVKVEKLSHSPREMDYPESASSARRANLALHGTPPIVAGIADDYTRATADAGLLVMSQYVANPKLRRFAGLLNRIAHRFDPRIVVWFEDTTPDDQQLLLDQQKADWECGAVTPDEIRSLRGRETMGEPSYESGYIGGGRMPLSEAAMPDEPDPVEPGEGDTDDVPDDEDVDTTSEEEE